MANRFEEMKIDIIREENKKWMNVFLAVALFSLSAQWNIPSEFRPIYLSFGSLSILIFALVVLFYELRTDKLLSIFIGFLLAYWLVAFPAAINGSDDNAAYLIFARDFYDSIEKTIQPLSERRTFSVGGIYAFQAPVLHWIGLYGLSLVEPVLGLILFFIIITSSLSNANRVGAYLLIGILGLVPLAGSKILANTASVFLLSVFSFALLELGKKILQQKSADSLHVFLVILLPLVAATFRPTTAPFNGLISLILLTLVGCKAGGINRIVIFGLFGSLIFYFAVVPYHEVASTYLYPILGRGSHVTAQGYSIVQSIAFEDHVANVFTTAFSDPLFYLNGMVFLLLMLGGKNGKFSAALAATFATYILFYLLIVIGTGGLASTRYIFPVSLAMMLSQSLALFDEFGPSLLPLLEKYSLSFGSAWMASVVAILVFVRLVVGPTVIDKRFLTYWQSHEEAANISFIIDLLDKQDGATLFISTGHARFITANIKGKYFIMDQPGMMSPWDGERSNYENGLNGFIVANNIRKLVMDDPACDRPEEAMPHVGWSGISEMARQRNRSAICNIIIKYDIHTAGSLIIAVSIKIEE